MTQKEYKWLITLLKALGMTQVSWVQSSWPASYQNYHRKWYTLRWSRQDEVEPNDSYRVVIIQAGKSDEVCDRIDQMLTRCDNMISFEQYSELEQDILYIWFEIADQQAQYDYMKSEYEQAEVDTYHRVRQDQKNNAEANRQVDKILIWERATMDKIQANLNRARTKYRAMERWLEHTKSRFIHEATQEKRQRDVVNRSSSADWTKQYI